MIVYIHDKTIEIQNKLNKAMEEYERMKNKIFELKEELNDE